MHTILCKQIYSSQCLSSAQYISKLKGMKVYVYDVTCYWQISVLKLDCLFTSQHILKVTLPTRNHIEHPYNGKFIVLCKETEDCMYRYFIVHTVGVQFSVYILRWQSTGSPTQIIGFTIKLFNKLLYHNSTRV